MRMDLGDWIIPLIFFGSIVLQIISSFFKKNKGGEKQPSPPSNETNDPSDSDWDDLMEALGQAPEKKYEIETVEPIEAEPNPVVTPPPVPQEKQYVAPEPRKSVFDLEEETQQKLEEANREAERILKGGQLGSFKRSSAYDIQETQHRETDSLIQTLKNRSAVRQAVVINELLQPPVALR